MYFDDHIPPHFHAQYNEFEAAIEIDNLKVYAGYLPPKQLKKVCAWASKNQAFLQETWQAFHDL